jgi:outer membrane receptor protein involved in Fe transport
MPQILATMNKLFISILTILCATQNLWAQSDSTPIRATYSIKGIIHNSKGLPVEYATVTLHRQADSILVKGMIANQQGAFEFENIQPGRYYIAAYLLGFTLTQSPAFELREGSLSLPSLVLQDQSKQLQEFTVQGQRPFIENKIDRVVVNVENSIVSTGGTALEVLQQAPGVLVDKDDNISLKGKAGVIIMIDGKPTNLSADGLSQFLRSMPSNAIDQVELIANPTSKYDASGNAGIINIKLKKNQKLGTNGTVSASLSQGAYTGVNGNLTLNNRSDKVNLYGSFFGNGGQNFEGLIIKRDYQEEQGRRYFDQESFSKRNSSGYGTKLGMDWFLNSNHTIGVMADIFKSSWNSHLLSETYIGDGQKVDSILWNKSTSDHNSTRQSYNVNYKAKLDTTGKELNVDLDYAFYNNPRFNHMFSHYQYGETAHNGPTDSTQNNQATKINIKSVKLDYTHPFRTGAKMEAGLKWSHVSNNNDYQFDSIRLGQPIRDLNVSNHFVYKEEIKAAYLNYSHSYKKWGYQLGLRAEHSHVVGNSLTLKQVNDTSYLNLFPSAFLSYTPSENWFWGINYSRRLTRPNYDNLNPFVYYIDRYTMASGNPHLKPQFSNAIEISNSFKSAINTSIGFTRVNDYLSRILEMSEDAQTGDSTIISYIHKNVSRYDTYNFNLSFPIRITAFWTSYTSFSFYYNEFETHSNGTNLRLNSNGFFGNTRHNFTLGKSSLELNYFYMSPQISAEGLMRMRHMNNLSIGFSMPVLNKAGTIRLNVNDVFNVNYFQGKFDVGNRTNFIRTSWDSRIFRLSFSYRFGNKQVQENRNRQTGLQDELNRVN